ncbi:MAG: DUF4252 domain-containing protein [Opitutae bacterium]
MKSIRPLVLIAASALAISSAALAAEPAPGAIDIGQLLPSAQGQFVEVNLSSGLLKFAAKIASRQDPDAAELIAGLKSIRVNVVGMDDSNRTDTIAKIEAVRRKLEAQGWSKMVTVREKADGDNVDVHVKQRGDEDIDGLVVTVIDHKGEAVFVNIVGNINADQISKIADKYNIDALKHVHVKTDHPQKAKDV